ncbi:hypothetical protein [Nocardiopsis coralliicola]
MDTLSDRECACGACGWPLGDSLPVVSRHTVSTGWIVYVRCVCGRIRVRTVRL